MSSPRFLAVVLAVGLMSVAAASAPSLQRPSWTAGDYWTYETNTTLTPGLTLTGTVTSTVQGTVPMPMGGGPVDAYEVLLSGSGSAAGTVNISGGSVVVRGAWILTGEERLEPTDLQPLYNLVDLSVNGTYQNLVPFSIRLQNTTSFQILADDWRYPLTEGSNGTLVVGYDFTQDVYGPTGSSFHQNGSGEWTFGFSMGTELTLASPAGTFPVFPIIETWPDGSVQRSFTSPQVGNDVRTESYTRSGNLTAVTTLASYRYQALETPTFFGLTFIQWAIVAPVAAAAAATALLLLRRSRGRRGRRPAEGSSTPDFTSGPRGP